MGKFKDFVPEVINLYGEDEQERIFWEMWLHKCLNQSYSDFKDSILNKAQRAPTTEEQEKAVHHSFEMLNRFTPSE